jgi:hypothetical protein
MAYKTNSGNGPFPSCYRACVEFRVDRSSFCSILLIVDLLTSMTERCLACIGQPRTNRLSHVLSLGCDTRSHSRLLLYPPASVDRRDSRLTFKRSFFGRRLSLRGDTPRNSMSNEPRRTRTKRIDFTFYVIQLLSTIAFQGKISHPNTLRKLPGRRDFVPR